MEPGEFLEVSWSQHGILFSWGVSISKIQLLSQEDRSQMKVSIKTVEVFSFTNVGCRSRIKQRRKDVKAR